MGGRSTEHINDAMNDQVAAKEQVPSPEVAAKELGAENNMVYIEADAYIGDPYALLGSVIEVRKIDNTCPDSVNAQGVKIEFSEMTIPGIVVSERSKLKEPLKRNSIMVDTKLSSDIGLLNYLKVQLDNETSFSLLVFDQAAGLVDRQDKSWNAGLASWKEMNKDLLQNQNICYIYAVIGFVQKYIIRRKYKKFDVKATGGAFGVNLNGTLYTSSEDYSLDIRYGLQTVILKRPDGRSIEGAIDPEQMNANQNDLDVLGALGLSGKANVSKVLMRAQRDRR